MRRNTETPAQRARRHLRKAIRRAILRFSSSYQDKYIAQLFGVPTARIRHARLRLGIKRPRLGRPKGAWDRQRRRPRVRRNAPRRYEEMSQEERQAQFDAYVREYSGQ